MDQNKSEQIARLFMETASKLGEAETAIRETCHECEQMKDSPELVDVLTGPEISEVRSALREMAMRIDRAAFIKFSP